MNDDPLSFLIGSAQPVPKQVVQQEPPLAIVIGALRDVVHHVEKETTCLHDRLKPALRPAKQPPQAIDQSLPAEKSSVSNLEQQLLAMIEHLEAVVRDLRSVQDRLCL